jgi:hypothetical protein
MMSEYCTMEEVALTLDPKASMIILAKNATVGKKHDNRTNMSRLERAIVMCGAGYVMMRFNCVDFNIKYKHISYFTFQAHNIIYNQHEQVRAKK